MVGISFNKQTSENEVVSKPIIPYKNSLNPLIFHNMNSPAAKAVIRAKQKKETETLWQVKQKLSRAPENEKMPSLNYINTSYASNLGLALH